MHINGIDLNLLRLFDAVFRSNSVSRAAEMLDLTQPAASQGLTRLRALLHDPLFMRAGRGVQPTPLAQRLAAPVRQALALLEHALADPAGFDPATAQRTFHLHLSDIGEGRFLPELMVALRERAPGVRVASRPLAHEQIGEALDAGRIDLALGFLPMLKDTRRLHLLADRYVVLVRAGHPFSRRRGAAALRSALDGLEFVAVRSHAQTLRILQQLQLQGRVRLVTEHFMVLPSIVRATELAAIMPRNIARSFGAGYAVVEPPLPQAEFNVAMHWSRRFEADAGNRWLRALVEELFRQ